ncbi:glycosyltransferase [Dietzia maris]
MNYYLTNSPAATSSLRAAGVTFNQVREISSAIESEWFEGTTDRYERGHIAMIGNSRPEKNHLFGLEAFFLSEKARRLTVYTDCADKLRAAESILRSNPSDDRPVEYIENSVISPGSYDEVEAVMHPSISESLPRVVLEAQARGRKVLASDVGSMSEWVPSAYCRQLTTTKDWARALDDILEDHSPDAISPKKRPLTVAEYTDALLELIIKE